MNEINENPVWELLDYQRDAIIEASAGTGKTYALEHIVEHLVENGVDIRKNLLVTFTEKAAGELKERIRKILVDSKSNESSEAVKHLDEATICTIHSFCQELLQEYPFESGMQMTADVIDSDRALIEKAVRSSMTDSVFRDNYGDIFLQVMEKWNKQKDVNGLCDYTVGKLEEIIASGLSPEEWHQRKLGTLKSSFVSILNRMPGKDKNLKPGVYVLANTNNGAQLGRQPHNDGYKEYFVALDKNIDILLSEQEQITIDERIGAANVIATGKLDFKLQTWNGKPLNPTMPFCNMQGLGIYKELADMASGFEKNLKDVVFMKLWDESYKEYISLKKQSRAMTFDDMILEVSRMVKDAVEDVGNAAKQVFLKSLRMRYRIVLVDEFQDTDNKQWDIFRLLFSSGVGEIGDTSPKQGCLIVVGDPKQAIYGFRGADIATYLRARKEIEDAGGQKFRLDKMFRSTREMVDAFNTIFKSGWFKNMSVNGLTIPYEGGQGAVVFPNDEAPKRLREFVYKDEMLVELLESVPMGAAEKNKTTCLPLFLENMAEEMKRLHESPFWKAQPDANARMNWSSMCVLVRSHADGDAAQKVLSEKGIPCRKYKEAGLFASAESESVLALFDYLSMPRNSGNLAALLLTPFFDVPLSLIEKRLADGDKKFDDLCDRWRTYIAKCEWIKFFESAMNDTDLGRPYADAADFVRHRAGIRQIFDQLLTQCGRARELSALSDALRAWRRDDSNAGEDGSVRYKESESDAVQIMTMHAAKGLEFNAVFIAAGFTGLNPQTPKEDRPAEEMETRRLFYVALTRAKYKLYLPWSRQAENQCFWQKKKEKANHPVLGTFLGEGIMALYSNASTKVKGVDKLPEKQNKVQDKKDQFKEAPGTGECPDLPPRLGMKGWRFKWDSFSSLNHHSAKKMEEVEGPKPKEDEGQNAPYDQNQKEEQKKSLVPKGALSGTVFHEVMEKLCEASDGIGFEIGQKSEDEFKELINETDEKKSPLLELVRRRMAANGVANQVRKEGDKQRDNGGEAMANGGAEKNVETTASVIARMAWNALRTELDFGGNNKFKLCEIPLKDRKAEVNFVLDESNLAGVREEGAGALNGSIDLLVRRDDGYYIVDWKTNALDDYEDATVATAMDEAGYHLQYKIYSLAAEKWLGENAVKGVAYLFVRGGETGTNASGKFMHPIKEEERAEFAKAFRVRIDASDKEEADKEKEEL